MMALSANFTPGLGLNSHAGEQLVSHSVKYSHQVKLLELPFEIIDRYKVPTMCWVFCPESDTHME